jgi:hypothetical protein
MENVSALVIDLRECFDCRKSSKNNLEIKTRGIIKKRFQGAWSSKAALSLDY